MRQAVWKDGQKQPFKAITWGGTIAFPNITSKFSEPRELLQLWGLSCGIKPSVIPLYNVQWVGFYKQYL